MNKKYLIPIKNGFLVYQPESYTVYRGKRKTAELWHILLAVGVASGISPIIDFISGYIWPFFDFSDFKIIIYTILMIIFGVLYYKYVYIKNKDKLLQLDLEIVDLIEVKEQIILDVLKPFVIAVISEIFLFCLILYAMSIIDNLDAAARLFTPIMYMIGIPIFSIENEFKGRFLLIKHLSQLNKVEK